MDFYKWKKNEKKNGTKCEMERNMQIMLKKLRCEITMKKRGDGALLNSKLIYQMSWRPSVI